MLARAGGLAATVVSLAGLRLLAAAIPAGGLPYWVTLTMDGRVAAVLAIVCLGTVILFGLAPALQLARTARTRRSRTRPCSASQDRGSARWTWVFLTAQLALTVMILSKLGLTVAQYRASQASEPVLDARHIADLRTHAAGRDRTANQDRRVAFYRNLRERPGWTRPRRGPHRRQRAADGRTGPRHRARRPAAHGLVTARQDRGHRRAYFQTLGLPIVEGRSFVDDSPADEKTGLMVNRRFAELFLPGGSPVGRRVRLGPPRGEPPAARRSTHGDRRRPLAARTTHRRAAAGRVRAAHAGRPAERRASWRAADIDPAVLAPMVRDAGAAARSGNSGHRPPRRSKTRTGAPAGTRASRRASSRRSRSSRSALATIGLAALTAHAVAQRSRELGIRLALGATPPGMVLPRAAARAVPGPRRRRRRIDRGQGVGPRNRARPISRRAALVVVLVIVTVSAWPAARAGRIDPLQMLRDQ